MVVCMARSNAPMHARPGDAREGGALPVTTSRRSALARRFSHKEDAGFINMGIIWTLVGFIVVVTIAAAFIGPVFTATADVNEALGDPNVTTGDESADAIKPVFKILIGLAVVLGIVGIVLGAIKFGKKGR